MTKQLCERAMLLRLCIHEWPAQRTERTLSDEIARNHGADANRIRTRKDLIDRKALKDILALSSQIRTTFHKWSLPWLDDGSRILPSAHFFAANSELKALMHDREEAVDRFIAQYPAHVAEARIGLNGLFDEAEYPTPAKIRKLFACEMIVLPLPAGDDFRVPLGNRTDEAEIRTRLETMLADAVAEATRDTWQRVHKVVKLLIERLRGYRRDPETGRVDNAFRDSLVGNVRELIGLLPGLNVAQSPELDAMAMKLDEALCGFEAEDLRRDEAARDLVAGRAEKILAEVSDFLA